MSPKNNPPTATHCFGSKRPSSFVSGGPSNPPGSGRFFVHTALAHSRLFADRRLPWHTGGRETARGKSLKLTLTGWSLASLGSRQKAPSCRFSDDTRRLVLKESFSLEASMATAPSVRPISRAISLAVHLPANSFNRATSYGVHDRLVRAIAILLLPKFLNSGKLGKVPNRANLAQGRSAFCPMPCHPHQSDATTDFTPRL